MLATAMAPGVHPARADDQYKCQQKTVKSQNNMECDLKGRLKVTVQSVDLRNEERGGEFQADSPRVSSL